MIIYVATLKKKLLTYKTKVFGTCEDQIRMILIMTISTMQLSRKIQFAIQFIFQKIVFVTNNTLQQTSQYNDSEANPSNDVKVETTLQALTGKNLAIISLNMNGDLRLEIRSECFWTKH